MKFRENERRCIGRYAEYPGAYAWPEYEYRCPECGEWHSCSSTTRMNEDGTESVLCERCEEEVFTPRQCENCDEEFDVFHSEADQFERFCSQTCQDESINRQRAERR